MGSSEGAAAGAGAMARLPGIDRILRRPEVEECARAYGRALVLEAVRETVDGLRAALRDGADGGRPAALPADPDGAAAAAAIARVRAAAAPSLRPVLNLTGTVLHTNLGRAPLPECAVAAVAEAARSAVNLELDLATGKRGERDGHVEAWLARLTGAEAATVVNNNAAAVLLVLNTFALGREVPVSRGELVEIGGSFRIPDVMARAGCRLVEVGATNRTHLRDFERAVGERTGAIMTVHTSNYVVQGFTAAPDPAALAALARARGVPFLHDLGSGTLVELERFGLPHEPTAREALAAGADLVTFSGDKLLGGPQAGIVAGRAELVAEVRRNPMRRALRVDKLTLAALGALLPLHANPERLVREVPTLRWLARARPEIREVAERAAARLRGRLAGSAVEVVDCASRIGSGALPVDTRPSAGLAIRPSAAGAGAGADGRNAPPARSVEALAAAFRALPRPVVGRIRDGALVLDLRCLEREDDLVEALGPLLEAGSGGPDDGEGRPQTGSTGAPPGAR